MSLASQADRSQENQMDSTGKKQVSSGVSYPTSVSPMCSGGGLRQEFKAQDGTLFVPSFRESPLFVSHYLATGSKSN